MGMERTPNKSQHTKLTLEKKILPPLVPGFELATFRSRVRRSYQQAILMEHTEPQNKSNNDNNNEILIKESVETCLARVNQSFTGILHVARKRVVQTEGWS